MEELKKKSKKRKNNLDMIRTEKKPIVVAPPSIKNWEKPHVADCSVSKKKKKKKKKKEVVNFASLSETRNGISLRERYVLGNCDNVGNWFLKRQNDILYNAKLNQTSPSCEIHVGLTNQTYVLGDFDYQGNWYMKKMDQIVKKKSTNIAKVNQASLTRKSLNDVLKPQMDNCDNGLDKYDKIRKHQSGGVQNLRDCSNVLSEKRINKLQEICAQFAYTGGACGNATKRRRWGGQNKDDGKRDVVGKTTILEHKGQTDSTQISLEDGVKYRMDSCDNCVDQYKTIKKHQLDRGKTLTDCCNLKSEKSIDKLMFSQFAYTGGAYGNVTKRRPCDGLIEDDVNANCSGDFQFFQPCSQSCGHDENIHQETENFSKSKSCSSSVSSINAACSSSIKLTNNHAPASFSLVSDEMEGQRRIDKVAGRGSSQKQCSISKARKQRSKEFQVVSPYLRNQRLESQAVVESKSERIIQDREIFAIPEDGEMHANMPEAKANSVVRVGVDSRDGKRVVLQKPLVSVQKGFDKIICGTIRNEVRIIARNFAVSELSMEKTVINTKPSKSKSARNRNTFTAAQKRDEAYKKRTPDNTWKPPRSPFHLLQEDHSFDPWRVLVICILLNVTTGQQVRKVLQEFFVLCPNAKVATEVDVEDIAKVTKSLGLSKKRSLIVQRFSQEYLEDTWTYVTQLYGVGKYAADAYAAFTNGKWDRIVPTDHMLNRYWDFLQSLENGHLP